ncbi:MAG: manganese-binding transcriptional regulator MntR [Micavibrio aeruginosavorus]|uniref:Transcriptional regulator MntR n=1 Tax=Micavibrio aeruginosavorus TaxID=349221 RepID=A0A7T5R4G7_9BACT|nr:MAG: manganese-binding transcriptional regulator MntR [Micavibrio aeruginosavorus]
MADEGFSDKNLTEGLVDPGQQARWFNRVREAHQAETAEDYVELIADLIEAQGEARVVDLANRFGVSHATVNKVIVRLNREGLVSNQPYRSLFLTETGKDLARRCKERHRVVLDFLLALGISPATAEADAEGVEHHVSEETLTAFRNFIARNR